MPPPNFDLNHNLNHYGTPKLIAVSQLLCMSLNDKLFHTPAPNHGRKRLTTPASAGFNFRSHKKRRISAIAADASTSSPSGSQRQIPVFQCENASTPSLDRFIPLRPQSIVPLTISPRTNRMYKSFGLLTSKRLSYKSDAENIPPCPSSSSSSLPSSSPNALNILRKTTTTSLFTSPKRPNTLSASHNLAKSLHPTLILDSPGLTLKPHATPLSWSLDDRIAVGCGHNVYYQDLATRKVVHFFNTGYARAADEAVSIAWGDEVHSQHLACIDSNGALQVYSVDPPLGFLVHGTSEETDKKLYAKSIAWSGHTLAYGLANGNIRFYDARERPPSQDGAEAAVVDGAGIGHRRSVVSLAYDTSGTYLASGDVTGNVHIWDIRTHKSLTQGPGERSSKIKHRATVKALAWCTWQPSLIATGSLHPEGRINFWSTKHLSTTSPIIPEAELVLNAAVNSIVWSPHCKELLSVHGSQFEHVPTTHRQRRVSSSTSSTSASLSTSTSTLLAATRNTPPDQIPPPTILEGPHTHSILVHSYPTLKRCLTLTRAHRYAVTAACLGPSGRDVFTASPREQAIKMWRVWGEGAAGGEEGDGGQKTGFKGCGVIR